MLITIWKGIYRYDHSVCVINVEIKFNFANFEELELFTVVVSYNDCLELWRASRVLASICANSRGQYNDKYVELVRCGSASLHSGEDILLQLIPAPPLYQFTSSGGTLSIRTVMIIIQDTNSINGDYCEHECSI